MYMMLSLVQAAGLLDFEPDLIRLKPDIFLVNHDGHTADKENLCKKLGIEYIVLERIPEPGLPATIQFRNKKRYEIPLQAVSCRRMD